MVVIKIKISEGIIPKTFCLVIPETMTLQEFYGVNDTFNNLKRLFNRGKSQKSEVITEIPPNFQEEEKVIEQNITEPESSIEELEESEESEIELFSKAIMIRLLKAYYSYPQEESERRLRNVIKDYALQISTREEVRKMIFKAISEYQITPQDVNLKRFPSPGDNDLKKLRIEE